MAFFKKADKNDVTRYLTPDGEDYIEMRAKLSKGEVNELMLSAPVTSGTDDSGNAIVTDRGAGLRFLERTFQLMVVRWSMVDEEGKPVPPSIESYRELEPEPGRWVDEKLNEHISATLGKRAEELEAKAKS